MGKDTKFCRNCGKELPIESTFCPYCMTKLIDVTTGGEIKVKKKKPIISSHSISIQMKISGSRFAHCNCGDYNFEQHDFWRQIG